jgi:flagellar basal-body rod protein FlgG
MNCLDVSALRQLKLPAKAIKKRVNMKTKWMLSLILTVAFLTGCQKNLRVSAPDPGSQAHNNNQQPMAKASHEEPKDQELRRAEIAKHLKAIRESNDAQQTLFARMSMRQNQVDVLLATSEAIDIAMEITLHNIANCKTTGFKRQRVQMQDGRIVDAPRIWQQGNSLFTGIPLDLMIDGEGFFQIRRPDGTTVYTRNGNLHLDRDGNVVTSEGNMLEPQITAPQDQISITIGFDGNVSVMQPGNLQPQQIGRIELARFPNPSGLEASGANLFMPTEASGEPVTSTPGEGGIGRIRQGCIEDSNVNMMEELIQLRMLQSWKKGVDQALTTISEARQ